LLEMSGGTLRHSWAIDCSEQEESRDAPSERADQRQIWTAHAFPAPLRRISKAAKSWRVCNMHVISAD
jgi:hypothetical protein